MQTNLVQSNWIVLILAVTFFATFSGCGHASYHVQHDCDWERSLFPHRR